MWLQNILAKLPKYANQLSNVQPTNSTIIYGKGRFNLKKNV